MSHHLKDVGSKMKLWGALAVQLLAIVLRDQQRNSGYPWSQVSEPSQVQCICECPETQGTKSSDGPSQFWGLAGLVGFGGVGFGLLAGFLIFRKGAQQNETGIVASRRRGGGVLSEPEEW